VGASNPAFVDSILGEHRATLHAARVCVRLCLHDSLSCWQAQAEMFYDVPNYPYADVAWLLFVHYQFLSDVLLDSVIVARLKRPFVIWLLFWCCLSVLLRIVTSMQG
jgi:hypothetical protein